MSITPYASVISPTLRGTSTGSTGAAAATSFTIAMPTNLTVGDMCLLWVQVATQALTVTVTGVTGWTAVPVVSGNSQTTALFYRVVLAGDAWPITVNISASATAVGIVYAASNVGSLDPVPTVSGQVSAASNTISVGSITTSNNSDLVVWFGGARAAAGVAAPTITLPTTASWTAECSQVSTTVPSASPNIGAVCADLIQPPAGPTGEQDGSIGGVARANGGMMVALAVPETIETPAFVPMYNLPPPVTSGSTIQSFTDVRGEIWVAKNGVNGGAWKRARDVLKCHVYRNAAWNTGTAGTWFTFNHDTALRDPYGLWTGNANFNAPIVGWYRISGNHTVSGNAASQWIQHQVFSSVVGAISIDTDVVSVAAYMTLRFSVTWFLNPPEYLYIQQACSTAGLGGITGIPWEQAQWEFTGPGP